MDPKALKEKVMQAVEACLAKEYPNENAALDALMADIEALKEKPSMKGLGEEDAGELSDESLEESEDEEE